jgi:hypothetical protein
MSKAIIKNPACGSGAERKNVIKTTDKLNITSSDDLFNALQEVFNNLITESRNLAHGIISLEIHLRDNHPYRYTINRQASFLCDPHKEKSEVRDEP